MILLVLALGLASVCVISLRWQRLRHRSHLLARLDLSPTTQHGKKRRVVGFFHPYCNAGGGGERVLWTALAHMQRTTDDVFVVYTGDQGVTKESMIAKVQSRFGITLDPETVHFVMLKSRFLVEDTTWKRFTLLGQSFGSVLLAIEALWFNREAVAPEVWIDSMGYAFTYPLVKYVCRIPVASYTHYPTISTDMLDRVRTRQAGHTNDAVVSKSRLLTTLKLVYYRLFAAAYRWALGCAGLIWVNSTWTQRHIDSILGKQPIQARLLYPPCDTSSLATLPLTPRSKYEILSLAQFRPEKEHALQLEAIARLFTRRPDLRQAGVRLILAGSVRNEGDSDRVESLRKLATELGIEDEVEFRINRDWNELRDVLGTSSIGLHTMFDEHFGITLVEFQAAGLIPLAHASAGPLLDIVTPYSSPTVKEGCTGYLATSAHRNDLPEAFAKQLEAIFALSDEEQFEVRVRARENARDRFGAAVFEAGWQDGWDELMTRRLN
ncbi:alpha-1,2-mannosyltransferase ALG11 [Sporobolomyces koalae]|uniref:alpha-1,2-mannosyltransferase ALG11 n=1 Tax=Sporobolomyces koalae TaxID=500713 RepID=UPI00316F038B